jgi:hypothetical protein
MNARFAMLRFAMLRRRRWLGAALIASLAINAFFVGAAATDVLRTKDSSRHGSSVLRFELHWLEGRLSTDAMAKVQAAVAATPPDARSRFARLRELRTGLGVLAAAPEPDRAAIDAKLADMRSEWAGLLADTQAVTMGTVLTLSPEERAGLAGSAAD